MCVFVRVCGRLRLRTRAEISRTTIHLLYPTPSLLLLPVACPLISSASLVPGFSNSCALTVYADGAGIRYELMAVVVHKGGMRGGHYIAYVKVEAQSLMVVVRVEPQ